MRMLRKNVLVDVGMPVNHLGSSVIVSPDCIQPLNPRGKVVSVGPKCLKLDESIVGKEVIFKPQPDLERRFAPRMSESLGLKPHWHILIHENDVQMAIAK